MSSASHHVIRQQYLHVELNGTEADGFALQRSLPALYQDALVPAIERVLDRCGPLEGHLCIDRLDIHAGETTLERLEFTLAESVAEAIERALREEISHDQSAQTIVAGSVRLKTSGHSITESFIYFLKTGSLPWSLRLPQGRSLEQAMLDIWRDASKSGIDDRSTVDAIRLVLVSDAARNRLTLQFSRVFLEALLSMLSPELKTVSDRVLHLLNVVDDSIACREHFERHLWATTIGGAAEGKVLTPELLIHETCRSLPESFVLAPALAEVLGRHWPGATHRASIDATQNNRIESTTPMKSAAKVPNEMARHPEAKAGIYIENAGVVLLHPFLQNLFTALGIASDDQLLQPERALGLLHYLITGQITVPEYELVLPKILCEVPLDTSVEFALELSRAEKEEANGLLEAVIRHWRVLGDTSRDGLRGTFLLRPGKISVRNDGDWLLQVESRGCDILLDQLPWGISTIKLPWMSTMLWVEWR